MEKQMQVKFQVGDAKHGRRVELTREYDGTFTITVHAASQRDDTQIVHGLDDAIFQKMMQMYKFIIEHKI